MASDEEDGGRSLAVAILELMPQSQQAQLKPLISSPLLMIEQLLMNSQIALASDLIQLCRSRGCSVADVEEKLLCYAAKALALDFPEMAETQVVNGNSAVKQRSKNAVFVLPPTAPTKDQWVADAQVTQCPCCRTVQFSMFNRRHHCRRCGRVVCSSCSPHRQLVEGYADVSVRTCVDCNFCLNQTSKMSSKTSKGGVLWSLSLDSEYNDIVRGEFSYEHAPNLALALAMVYLCQDKDNIANFLLNQSSSVR